MFSEKELNEFVNRMFDNAVNNSNDGVKEGLKTFRKYLGETKMCSLEYLKKLDKIIECSSELLALKAKVDSIDVTSIIKTEPEKTPKKKEQPPQKTKGTWPSYQANSNNHRSHYVEPFSSSSCGGSTPSYSSSCGGSSPTYRGC